MTENVNRCTDPRLSTLDLAWLITAHEQHSGYIPFKAETIQCLRELYHRRVAEEGTPP